MSPNDQAAAQPAQQTPSTDARPEPQPVIHGLDKLIANGAAIGVSSEQPETDNVQSTTADKQDDLKTEQVDSNSSLSLDEKLKDPEVLTFIEREKARVITAAQKKWNDETLQKKLQADRQQREEAIRELALKAEAGDTEALMELGKTVQAQVLRKTTVQEFAQAWFTEADETVHRLFGTDQNVMAQMHVTNFGKVADWVEAMVSARVASELNATKANFQKEVDRLAEAKAAELITQRRQNLPVPDTTQQVAGGGAPTRKWTTFADATSLYVNEEISDEEMLEARTMLANGLIQPGKFSDDF